jgi:soluble lytic murein transglycosylase
MPPKPIDADIWIENIPFSETRSYVQRVLEHIVAYAWDQAPQIPRLTPLLSPVEPLPENAALAGVLGSERSLAPSH